MPQHRYVTCLLWHRLPPSFRLNGTPNRRQSCIAAAYRSAFPRLSRPDFLRRRINFNEYNAVTVGNSGAIWTGAGGLTISCSRGPFRTAYLCFILIELRYSLHSDCYARAARMNQCFVLFVGSEHSMCNNAQSRLADIIYSSQTEQAGCEEWQRRISKAQSADAMSLKHVQHVFPFYFFCIMFILSF